MQRHKINVIRLYIPPASRLIAFRFFSFHFVVHSIVAILHFRFRLSHFAYLLSSCPHGRKLGMCVHMSNVHIYTHFMNNCVSGSSEFKWRKRDKNVMNTHCAIVVSLCVVCVYDMSFNTGKSYNSNNNEQTATISNMTVMNVTAPSPVQMFCFSFVAGVRNENMNLNMICWLFVFADVRWQARFTRLMTQLWAVKRRI